jgi:hypothetical protein
MTKLPENQSDNQPSAVEDKDWVKPRIESFLPAKAAEGISYRPTDGISNLTA